MRRNRNANRDLTRRQALAGAAATASTILAWRPAAQAAASLCILTPEAAQGPFYFDPTLVRTDITEGKPGASLALTLQVVEAENWGETDKGQRQFRDLMTNAKRLGRDDVYQDAFRQLCGAEGRNIADPLESEFANVMSAPSRRFARPPLRRTPLCRNPTLFEVRRRPASILA